MLEDEPLITPGVIVIDPRNLPPGSTITVQIVIGPAVPDPEPEPEPEPPSPPTKRYLGQ